MIGSKTKDREWEKNAFPWRCAAGCTDFLLQQSCLD